MLGLSLALLQLAAWEKAVPALMDKHHAPGAIVAYVEGGRPAEVRAFGYADVRTGRKVEAATSAFRTGSISKVFTGMAAQVLVQQGRVRLDQDWNEEVPSLPIDPAFGQPITLRNLLTHTAGLDDKYIGKSARSPAAALPLGPFLKAFLPPRVMPAGEIYAYSNLGIALAGYLIETAAGKPFAQFVNEAVFQPLDMKHSNFILEERLTSQAAFPHHWNGRNYEVVPWDYLQDAPAGMHMGTGEDMAKLIEWALANPGHAVFQPLFSNHPKLTGSVGWAWHRYETRGRLAVGHDGGYMGVRARLRIFPGQGGRPGFGYFIAVNSEADGVIEETERALWEKAGLKETSSAAPAPPAEWERDTQRFQGYYRTSRLSRTTLTKAGVILGMLGEDLFIGTTSDGAITMPKLDGNRRRMVQVEPLLFQSLDEDYRCAFRAGSDGKITHLFTSGTSSLDRLAWYETLSFQRGLFFACLPVLFLLTFGGLRRRLLAEGLQRPTGWMAGLSLFHLAGLGLVFMVLTPPMELQNGFPYGLPWPIWLVQALSFGAAGALIWLIVAWLRHLRVPSFGTLAVLAGLGHIWFLHTWNLLGFRF